MVAWQTATGKSPSTFAFEALAIHDARCRDYGKQLSIINNMPSLSRILSNSSPNWSLCFSGAGHLIVYHFGVAQALISRIKAGSTKSDQPKIHSVAGSSSGALVAAAIAFFPERIDEYVDRFLQDRGHAFHHLQQMLLEEEECGTDLTSLRIESRNVIQPKWLGIATTECSTGSLRIFEFDTSSRFQNGKDSSSSHERLIAALQASCTIPQTFHPWDVFSKYPSQYPDEDGIEIDGSSFVDGGIAAPCPIWRKDTELDDKQEEEAAGIILISPSSGSSPSAPPILGSIRPSDSSFKFPLVGDLSSRGENGAFRIRPSIQNLQAIVASAGVVQPQILHDWHQRGIEDANEFLAKYETEQ